ncbi:MAG TPA: acyl-CoA dehydrogenase family protein [Acidimicrobiia bacterium]|nr:acyl-CoA dehydrogenase family protein [Acidimicrobiia bacterium]
MTLTLSARQADLLARATATGSDLARQAPSDNPGRVDRSLVAALAEAGLLGRLYPDDGLSAMDLCLIRQGLARTNPHAETAFALQGLGSYPIHQSARSEIASRWIPGVVAGEIVPAFALTEPEAGSDAAALALAAERDGEGWRLTGDKAWISNAPEADVYVVFARTTPGAGSRGVSAFLVPGDSPGLSGSSTEMLAPHPIGRVVFDEVAVPPEHVLGQVDAGFRVAMGTLDLFRPSVGAFAVGMAEAALDIAVRHAEERHAFGKPIFEFQAVSHSLADMAARTTAARLLVYAAATAYDTGDHRSLTSLAAMAKLTATETAQSVVDGAIQVLGARGLEADHPLARLYLDVRAPRIYEGTSEIQRDIIARELRKAPIY